MVNKQNSMITRNFAIKNKTLNCRGDKHINDKTYQNDLIDMVIENAITLWLIKRMLSSKSKPCVRRSSCILF